MLEFEKRENKISNIQEFCILAAGQEFQKISPQPAGPTGLHR